MTDPAPAKKTVAQKKAASGAGPHPEELEERETAVHQAQRETGQKVNQTLDDLARKATFAELAAPFPADWVEKLPRNLRKNDDDKGQCREGSRYTADGHACGGYHARSIHLDYVGHAGITMRLNDVLGPEGWDFQPFALDGDAMPIMGRQFYARLTILGVTKWDLADNFSSAQEAYGDALRRCAMRFGVGTYLWSKSEQALERARAVDNPPEEPRQERQGGPPAAQQGQPAPQAQQDSPEVQEVTALLRSLTQDVSDNLRHWWTDRAADGVMPAMDNWKAITPAQVGLMKAEVFTIQEALGYAPVGPQ